MRLKNLNDISKLELPDFIKLSYTKDSGTAFMYDLYIKDVGYSLIQFHTFYDGAWEILLGNDTPRSDNPFVLIEMVLGDYNLSLKKTHPELFI